MLKKESIISISILLLYIISCNIIYNKNFETKKYIINNNGKVNISSGNKINNEIIGKLIIKKLNISEYLYNKESKHNNVNENITILKESTFPNHNNSIMYIAAHSGTGKLAYFKHLDQLELNDKIILIYNNKQYVYIVYKIWEEDKNGYIHITNNNKKQLILTTCSPKHKNKQLIISSILKESN